MPAGFDLGPLPDGIAPDSEPSERGGSTPYDVILAFCPDVATLLGRFEALRTRIPADGALWICWPKRASGMPTDLTENVVRDAGLAVGLVDVKVAAMDAVWSGLKFVYRLADRPKLVP